MFGLFYAGFLSTLPLEYAHDVGARLGFAVGMGLVLWLVAAVLVMLVWLQLVGIDAPIPNLTLASLAGHVVWGITMGVLYYLGDRWLARDICPQY